MTWHTTKRALPVVFAAAACAMLLAAPDTDAKGAKGPKATFVKGSVEVSKTQDGDYKKLKRNRRVKVGSFVRTGEGARAELRFDDGSVVRIGPSSTLNVGSAGFDSKSKAVSVETTLVGGKAWANVSKLVGSEAKFKVKTENAVAGVRGTVFRVNIARDKASVVKVYNGAVAVSNSPVFANETDDKDGSVVGPINKDRKLLTKAPFEQVTQKEFEQIVSKMMQVTVRPNGQMTQAASFTAEDEKVSDEAEWVNWNLACDQGQCSDY
jgi:hypothetical protein